MRTKAINSLELTTPTTSLPSAQADRIAPPSLKSLSDSVKALSTKYFALCKQQQNLTSDDDEKKLLQGVIELSLDEADISEDLSAHGTLSKADAATIRTISQLENMDEEKVACLLDLGTTYHVHKQLAILRAPKLQPQQTNSEPRVTAPVLTVTARPSSNSDIVAAQAATFEFKRCIATPNVANDTKLALAEQMIQAIDKVKDSNDLRVQPLKVEKYKLLQAAFAPTIPEEIMTEFRDRLYSNIVPNIAKIATKCHSLPEYIAAKRQEEKVIEEIANLKAEFSHKLNLDQSNLQFKLHDSLDHKIDTELTTCLEEVTIRFSREQEQRATEQLSFIGQNYVKERQKGDGNCLFRSIVTSMGIKPDAPHPTNKALPEHRALRNNLNELMRQNKVRYEPLVTARLAGESLAEQRRIRERPGKDDFEKYLHYMSTNGTWGGTPEIQAASDFFGTPIVATQIAHHNRSMNTFVPEGKPTLATPLVIQNSNGTHFDTLLPR